LFIFSRISYFLALVLGGLGPILCWIRWWDASTTQLMWRSTRHWKN